MMALVEVAPGIDRIEGDLGGDAPVDVGLRGGETLRLGGGRRVEVYDRAGQRLIPPRYYYAAAYELTIRRLRALDPELLLTAHHKVMERGAAREFLARALEFGAAVRGGRQADLRALTREIDARVGPFSSFTHELAASVRAHLAEV